MKLKTKTIYIYYDYPIIFSATNEFGKVFICLFADETASCLRYICSEVSVSLLENIENNKIDIRSVFEKTEKIYSLIINAQSEESIEAIEINEDISHILPEKDFFIGSQEGISNQTINNIYPDIPVTHFAVASPLPRV